MTIDEAQPAKGMPLRPPVAPWDRREVPSAFDAESAATRLGHGVWFEMRLFEVLGRWVAQIPEPDVKVRFAANGAHHAWHAELFRRCLPELADLDPATLVAPPNDELVAFVDALAAPTAPEQTVEKAVGVYRVAVPRAIAAYTYQLNRSSHVSDAPAMRALRIVLADLQDDLVDGEIVVQSLLVGAAEVERAAAHQSHLESLVVAAGGISGPGTLGPS